MDPFAAFCLCLALYATLHVIANNTGGFNCPAYNVGDSAWRAAMGVPQWK